MGIKCLSGHYSSYKEPPREFIVDTDADFENLPDACPGSKAISLWSKKERVVNTKGRWVPYGECAINAPILDLTTGTAVSEVTETVTADSEFSHDLSTVGMGTAYRIDCPAGDIPVKAYEREEHVCIDKHYKVRFTYNDGTEPAEFYLDDDGNNSLGLGLYFTELGLALENPEQGTISAVLVPNNWEEILTEMGASAANIEMLVSLFPPNTFLVMENAFTNISSLETFSLTCKDETEVTVLSVTDTNDEGIVASYEVYADDALVDTVPKAETIDATALGVTAGASVTVKAKSIIDTTSEASNAVIFE